jgi:hypothetical protein
LGQKKALRGLGKGTCLGHSHERLKGSDIHILLNRMNNMKIMN